MDSGAGAFIIAGIAGLLGGGLLILVGFTAGTDIQLGFGLIGVVGGMTALGFAALSQTVVKIGEMIRDQQKEGEA